MRLRVGYIDNTGCLQRISIPSGAIKSPIPHENPAIEINISIPSGAIKSSVSISNNRHVIGISIPSGAIKRVRMVLIIIHGVNYFNSFWCD